MYDNFLGDVSEDNIWFRTTDSDRTYQVAGGLLAGMGYLGPFRVITEPANVSIITDALVIRLHDIFS